MFLSAVYIQLNTVSDLNGSMPVIVDWLCLDSLSFN